MFFKREEINKKNKLFSPIRSTIETAFYGNNVRSIENLSEAYKLAKNSCGTVELDMPVYKPELLGLPEDANMLLFNDGRITGRYAKARVIIDEERSEEAKYSGLAREAVYNGRHKEFYHAESYIGLDKDFMVKAHLMIPVGHENIMYNWLLNFQSITEEYLEMYGESIDLEEGDIYIYSDPDYRAEGHEDGLALFDPENNCAMILGMRYFGEHKKGTLTLAWGIANRNGYASCHGGMKRYGFDNGDNFTIGVFGLSGSGKSTLTHERHGDKYDITILHDDAYVISTENSSSVALEPSYFDKTQDYPLESEENKYLLTVQNCAVTLDQDGKKVIVTEDIRNGNGRAVKSKLWTENRVNKIAEPVDAIVWLMKDSALPPVLKINDPVLASVLGGTLATKRSTAERLSKDQDLNALVIEPYANPFRTYPLEDDYSKFKELFEKKDVDCYIFNTGNYLGKDIPKDITLAMLEEIVTKKASFKDFGESSLVEYIAIDGYEPNFKSEEYRDMLKQTLNYRIEFLTSKKLEDKGRDKLPDEAIEALLQLKDEFN